MTPQTCLERGSQMDFKTTNFKGVIRKNLANPELCKHQSKHRCLWHGSCCCRTHDPKRSCARTLFNHASFMLPKVDLHARQSAVAAANFHFRRMRLAAMGRKVPK